MDEQSSLGSPVVSADAVDTFKKRFDTVIDGEVR